MKSAVLECIGIRAFLDSNKVQLLTDCTTPTSAADLCAEKCCIGILCQLMAAYAPDVAVMTSRYSPNCSTALQASTLSYDSTQKQATYVPHVYRLLLSHTCNQCILLCVCYAGTELQSPWLIRARSSDSQAAVHEHVCG